MRDNRSTSAAGEHSDDSLGLEYSERLAQGCSRDLESLEHHRLVRQRIARRHAGTEDVVGDLHSDRLREFGGRGPPGLIREEPEERIVVDRLAGRLGHEFPFLLIRWSHSIGALGPGLPLWVWLHCGLAPLRSGSNNRTRAARSAAHRPP